MAAPRRLKPSRHVWTCAGIRIPEPTMRQLLMIIVAVGAVFLLGNMLSVRFQANSRATTLWGLAWRPAVEPRGIVLPLFDGIALLGISLILELRAMQIDLPIEVPHCGDLNEAVRDRLSNDDKLDVRVYDVCEKAAAATEVGALGFSRPLFCNDLQHCHRRFRSFDIKIISLLFSQFQEVMMVDADVMFLQNPSSLWDLDKFVSTGTLFFHDRISFTDAFLAERVSKDSPARSRLHEFIERFDRSAYQVLPTLPRRTSSMKNGKLGRDTEVSLRTNRYEPSEFLKRTHSWNMRAGHEADSSVMLWSKVKQQRATAIVGSFVTLHHANRPPSYGDKEFYFLACEVADADYAFSDYGVGSIGLDWRGKEKALCGDALHYYPVKKSHVRDDEDVPPLYINSDHIATWDLDKDTLLRSKARPADHYAGSFEEMKLAQECPFNVKTTTLSQRELDAFRRRQKFYKMAESWHPQPSSKAPTDNGGVTLEAAPNDSE